MANTITPEIAAKIAAQIALECYSSGTNPARAAEILIEVGLDDGLTPDDGFIPEQYRLVAAKAKDYIESMDLTKIISEAIWDDLDEEVKF